MSSNLTSDDQPSIAVAIAARDPNLQTSLVRAISGLVPGTDVCELSQVLPWTVPSGERTWAFVDASLISPERLPVLLNFNHLVVFNLRAAPNARFLLESHLPARKPRDIDFVDYLITSEMLHELYGSQLQSLLSVPDSEHLVRAPSAAPDAPPSVLRYPPYRSSILDDFSAYVRGSIHDDPERLKAEFVHVSSTTYAAQLAAVTEAKLAPLHEAEAQLRRFVVRRESSGLGHFVVGPAGVGKTTLTQHVTAAEEELGTAICLRLDYTTASSKDIARPGLLTSLAQFPDFLSGLNRASNRSDAALHAPDPFLGKALGDILSNNGFAAIPDIPPVVDLLLSASLDRGTMIDLYGFYCRGERNAASMAYTESDLASLSDAAQRWFDSVAANRKELFVRYVFYVLDVSNRDTCDIFSYRTILRSLLLHPTFALKAVQAIAAWGRATLGSVPMWITDTSEASTIYAWAAFLPLTQLQSLVVTSLNGLCQNNTIIFVFDNIDQKQSEDLEAALAFHCVNLFLQELGPCLPFAKAVLAVRDRTLRRHPWMRPFHSWELTFVLPPELRHLVHRRCHSWIRSGRGIADGRALLLAERVKEWTEPREVEAGGRAEASSRRTRPHDLLHIIEARHPFNVRHQLDAFADCCRNAILQRAVSQGGTSERDPWWKAVSYESYIRMFLLGGEGVFREDTARAPNLYDAQAPTSPFNACLRFWLLDDVIAKQAFAVADIKVLWVERGVPAEMVESSMQAFQLFNLIRQYRGRIGEYECTIWGRYFAERVAFDLPYLATVWWVTPMLSQFGLGTPSDPRASELRGLARTFLYWLRTEERMARAALVQPAPTLRRLFDQVSYRVQWSLHRIEDKLE